MASPNLTVRYTHTGNVPADISSVFFAATEIPHVKCFAAGRYIVVSLASENDLTEHTNHDNTKKLASLGFTLVESREARCARTIMAFRVPRFLLERVEELKDEIAHKNNIHVEKVTALKTRVPTLKITAGNITQADNLMKLGVRAFSVIIPPQQLEKERHTNITQCYKCYQFTHTTNTCTDTTQHCSKCSATGHTHKTCPSDVTKCLNCGLAHVAVSFDCQAKKDAAKIQSNTAGPSNPTTQPTAGAQVPSEFARHAYATAVKTGAIPRRPNVPNTTQPPTSTPNPPPIDSTTAFTGSAAALAAKIQICTNSAAQLAGDDPQIYATLLPIILQANNLPTITIPPIALEIAAKKKPVNIIVPENLPTDPQQNTSNQDSSPSTPITPPSHSTPKRLPLKSPPPPSPGSSECGSVSVCSNATNTSPLPQQPTNILPSQDSSVSSESQDGISEVETDSASLDEVETQGIDTGTPSDPPFLPKPPHPPPNEKRTPIQERLRSAREQPGHSSG